MSTSSLVGKTLGGRYQIESLIGQGGMASVYKANDPNLRRAVAIKVIHPHLSGNPEFFRRFEEEATAVAHLRHPNIVQMYDFSHDGDLYYMVMEFLMGETLQTRLIRLNKARRRLGCQEAIHYTANICDAAYYAHQRGLIHRDIKPGNIMLDFNGEAILMDFGIAHMVGASQHTATGAVLGTALYMSPEQIQGLQIDNRADIYSIGITLFEILSGRPPYEADSAMTLMMMQLNDPIPDLRELQPNTSPELVAIVNKALAKNREQRYQSANELAVALRQIPEASQKGSAPVSKPAQPGPTIPEATFIEAAALKGISEAKPEVSVVKDTGETIIEAAAAKDTGETLIEAAVVRDTGETLIESAGPAILAKEAAKPVTSPQPPDQHIRIEQAVQPDTKTTKPAVETLPENKSVERKKRKIWIPILAVVLFLFLGGGGYIGYNLFFAGNSADTPLPSPTTESVVVIPVPDTPEPAVEVTPTFQPSPTETEWIDPTSTSTPTARPKVTKTDEPSPTPTSEVTVAPAGLSIGGADKIAFFSGKNIWIANLDGSELTQLTHDGTDKTYLRWLPDGQGLSYISGKCIEKVPLSGKISDIACFNNADKLEAFEVSPDGKQVVIGLDSQVYLVPFDLEALSTAYSHDSLSALATCENMAPYTRNTARYVRWSSDSTRWALVIQVPYNGMRADVVAVFPVDTCYPNDYAAFEIQFPPPHFTYPGYERFPSIQDLGFDGHSLFAMHGITRNDGFGDLHLFNMETYKLSQSVNPVNNTCCYRDAQFSPDGTYLVFAYQDINQGKSSTTRLYYIPYGTIGTGMAYEPLPLPEITDPREQPQPALRPVIP